MGAHCSVKYVLNKEYSAQVCCFMVLSLSPAHIEYFIADDAS